MTRSRADSIWLLVLGSAAFLALGFLQSKAGFPLMDFNVVYYSAECLFHHCDPYSQTEVLRLYAQHADVSSASATDLLVLGANPYLPSEFGFTFLFALMPFKLAQLLWFVLIAGGTILGSFAVWDLSSDHAPEIAAILLCFCLANSGSVIYFGNPAGVAVPLCILAVWCFLRERFLKWGILCLALSLMLKPQDAGLVWLFFLLSVGSYRRRALQTLALVVALSVPATLWITHVSPHWFQELRSLEGRFFGHGGINNPNGAHGTLAITSLQPIFSYFWDNPRIYHSLTLIVCAPLLVVWVTVTLKSRSSQAKTYFALASIAVLSLLPVYHRQYDAKIIILTIPAFAMLWREGGPTRWLALLVSLQGYLLTADLVWTIFVGYLVKARLLQMNEAGNFGPTMTPAMNFPVPISLLIMGVFYLWVYARRAHSKSGFERLDVSSANSVD
jgi:hypothetical protein